jgi:serine/threonine protein kinase
VTLRDSQTDEAGYEVLAPLSSGTYGENLLAMRRDALGLGKLFVLRQVRRGLSADRRVRDAFVEIGRRAVRLSHPNLIQTFELGERGGALFAATEHLEGEPLDAIMAAVAPAPNAVDARFWLLIAADVLSGLHHAHELRDFDGSELELVHGGVTPRKIFVTYSGRVVVTDFGLAALATHAKRLEGTYLPEMVAYAAPEQREGRPCDARADIYAVGIILWELLSGRRHRQSSDPNAEMEPLPPLEQVKPEIDRGLADVVMRAIEREPADRWQSAADLRDALEPFVDRGGVVRRSALGEAIGALFARSREKIPSLLSKRSAPLTPQDAYAVTLAGAPASSPPSRAADSRGDPDEEEAPFLLASPIESVSDANVISVTELVSDSELLSSVELIGTGAESGHAAADDHEEAGAEDESEDDSDRAEHEGEAEPSSARASASASATESAREHESVPDSATPLSLGDFEIPVDEASAKSVNSIKAASSPIKDVADAKKDATDATDAMGAGAAPAGGELDAEREPPASAPRSAESPDSMESGRTRAAGASAEPSPDSGERPTLTDTSSVWDEARKKSSSSVPPSSEGAAHVKPASAPDEESDTSDHERGPSDA